MGPGLDRNDKGDEILRVRCVVEVWLVVAAEIMALTLQVRIT